jgi:biotin carboxyl carrier protein
MTKFVVKVNGESFEVEVEKIEAEENCETIKPAKIAAKPAKKLAPKSAAPKPVSTEKKVAKVSGDAVKVTAPMSGNIISIKVKPGDAVGEGDVLCVLEAMKMENEICAPRAGTVESVLASEGSSVSVGDTLILIG